MVNNELKHHGIKGMRWGVRRSQKQLARTGGRPSSSRQAQQDRMRSMSDAEMRQRINRMRLEQEYSQLMKSNKSPLSKFASSVATEVGKNLASKYITAYASSKLDPIFGINQNDKKNDKKN